MKRLSLPLVLLLFLGALGEDALTAEELAESTALDRVEDVTEDTSGPVWEEATLAYFPVDAPAARACRGTFSAGGFTA